MTSSGWRAPRWSDWAIRTTDRQSVRGESAIPMDSVTHHSADPIVIAGMPRSGTTLLRRLCNDHPQMRVTNEFSNFAFVGDSLPVYAARAGKRVLEINGASRIIGQYGTRTMNYLGNVRAVSAHLLRLARLGVGRVTVAALVEEAREAAPGARVVGDKMPPYIFMMDKLVLLPDLRRVVIYRDCRDVTSSFLRMVRTKWRRRLWVRKWNTAERIAARWVRGIEIMECHHSRLFAIRYEDLVQRPEAELRRLAEWLGVEPSGFDATQVSDAAIGKYRQGLSDQELDAVLKVAGPTLRRLGYPPD